MAPLKGTLVGGSTSPRVPLILTPTYLKETTETGLDNLGLSLGENEKLDNKIPLAMRLGQFQ